MDLYAKNHVILLDQFLGALIDLYDFLEESGSGVQN